MAVDQSKLQALTLDEFLDGWEADGYPIPAGLRSHPAGKQMSPWARDRVVAGPQHAFIRTMEALLASRWRSAVGEMKETPAEDEGWQPAELAILNDFGCRIFDPAPIKPQRVRFQDHVILQRTDNTFNNYVEVQLTTESVDTGDAVFQVKVLESGATEFEPPISVTLSHDGSTKFYTLKFDIGPRQIGSLIVVEILRDAASVSDTLAAEVGLIAARLI